MKFSKNLEVSSFLTLELTEKMGFNINNTGTKISGI